MTTATTRREPRRPKVWTEQLIVAAIRTWVKEYGELPRANDWRQATAGYPCLTSVVDRFRSWNEAILAAGFTPRRSRSRVSRVERERVGPPLAGPPADSETEAVLRLSRQRRLRGTRPDSPARRLPRRRWSRDEMVEAIQRFAVEHGRVPTANAWHGQRRHPDYPSESAVERGFGSWNAAIEAAGFEPRGQGG